MFKQATTSQIQIHSRQISGQAWKSKSLTHSPLVKKYPQQKKKKQKQKQKKKKKKKKSNKQTKQN